MGITTEIRRTDGSGETNEDGEGVGRGLDKLCVPRSERVEPEGPSAGGLSCFST